MPRISQFDGIIIGVFWDEGHHGRPHFHAYHGEHEASLDLAGEVIAGFLPRRILHPQGSGWSPHKVPEESGPVAVGGWDRRPLAPSRGDGHICSMPDAPPTRRGDALPAGYPEFLAEVKTRIAAARTRAALAVLGGLLVRDTRGRSAPGRPVDGL
jgi:hypothetical protein